MSESKENKIMKASNMLFWGSSGVYILLTAFMYILWDQQGLFLEADAYKTIQDYTKTVAQTNLSVSLGIATLLVGVAALNSKSIKEVIPNKDAFLSTLKAMILFVFSNFCILILSYSKDFVMNHYLHAGIMIYTSFSFSYLMHTVINLFQVTLGKIKFPK
ncbi:hypothetical protein ACT7DN_31460 [Bacillus paranthracis]